MVEPLPVMCCRIYADTERHLVILEGESTQHLPICVAFPLDAARNLTAELESAVSVLRQQDPKARLLAQPQGSPLK